MTEKEARALIDTELISSFNIWWREEAMQHMIPFSEEGEKTVYDLCYTAWMNGASLRGDM